MSWVENLCIAGFAHRDGTNSDAHRQERHILRTCGVEQLLVRSPKMGMCTSSAERCLSAGRGRKPSGSPGCLRKRCTARPPTPSMGGETPDQAADGKRNHSPTQPRERRGQNGRAGKSGPLDATAAGPSPQPHHSDRKREGPRRRRRHEGDAPVGAYASWTFTLTPFPGSMCRALSPEEMGATPGGRKTDQGPCGRTCARPCSDRRACSGSSRRQREPEKATARGPRRARATPERRPSGGADGTRASSWRGDPSRIRAASWPRRRLFARHRNRRMDATCWALRTFVGPTLPRAASFDFAAGGDFRRRKPIWPSSAKPARDP